MQTLGQERCNFPGCLADLRKAYSPYAYDAMSNGTPVEIGEHHLDILSRIMARR